MLKRSKGFSGHVWCQSYTFTVKGDRGVGAGALDLMAGTRDQAGEVLLYLRSLFPQAKDDYEVRRYYPPGTSPEPAVVKTNGAKCSKCGDFNEYQSGPFTCFGCRRA